MDSLAIVPQRPHFHAMAGTHPTNPTNPTLDVMTVHRTTWSEATYINPPTHLQAAIYFSPGCERPLKASGDDGYAGWLDAWEISQSWLSKHRKLSCRCVAVYEFPYVQTSFMLCTSAAEEWKYSNGWQSHLNQRSLFIKQLKSESCVHIGSRRISDTASS